MYSTRNTLTPLLISDEKEWSRQENDQTGMPQTRDGRFSNRITG
jgi:hypothetical protein